MILTRTDTLYSLVILLAQLLAHRGASLGDLRSETQVGSRIQVYSILAHAPLHTLEVEGARAPATLAAAPILPAGRVARWPWRVAHGAGTDSNS